MSKKFHSRKMAKSNFFDFRRKLIFFSKMKLFMTSPKDNLYIMNHQLYFKHQFGSIEHSRPPGGSRDLIQSENKILKLLLSGASRWSLMTDDVEFMFKMNSIVHFIWKNSWVRHGWRHFCKKFDILVLIRVL